MLLKQVMQPVLCRSFGSLLEIEISEIHIPVRQYADGEDIPALAEANFEEIRSQAPVVPLTPSHGVCRVKCGWDLHRPCSGLSIYVDGYCSAAIRRVKKISGVGPCVRDVDSYVEPLSWLGPADIGHISRRDNLVEGVVVNRDRLSLELRVRSIHALVDAKFIKVSSIGRI